MVFRFAIHFLIVIISLSSRERRFPIQIRQWCRNQIGVFPFGFYPHGFLCIMAGFVGLQHHRDHDYVSTFSKLRKDLQSQIWDPGDSNDKSENGGLRSLTSHIHGSLFVFGSAIGISVPPRSMTLLFLCIDVGILFHLLFISLGIWELLLKLQIRDTDLRFGDVIAIPQSSGFVAPVHDHIGCDYFSFVMDICLHQLGFCWSALSNLSVGSVNFWRQGLVCVVDFGRLRNALPPFRWEPFDMRSLGIWDAMVNLSVVMLERITKWKYLTKTLVRKFWCHHVYISGLVLDTSGFMLRFVKRSFSLKLLHTNRNKEKSNMKLDNNQFSDRLASKTTLRKASSNSLLLYFS